VRVVRERPTFVEAEVRRGSDSVVMQWAQDSAYRRYSEAELRALDFDGRAPDAAQLASRWRAALDAARETVALLPADEAGKAVLARDGGPYRGDPAGLRQALAQGELLYHEGCIRGAFPRLVL
jgi:hypothetical protein